MELCFSCGKEFFNLATPMRCDECVKNKIPLTTSPVSNSFFVLTPEKNMDENFIIKITEEKNTRQCLEIQIK